jgi:hypothetical protein
MQPKVHHWNTGLHHQDKGCIKKMHLSSLNKRINVLKGYKLGTYITMIRQLYSGILYNFSVRLRGNTTSMICNSHQQQKLELEFHIKSSLCEFVARAQCCCATWRRQGVALNHVKCCVRRSLWTYAILVPIWACQKMPTVRTVPVFQTVGATTPKALNSQLVLTESWFNDAWRGLTHTVTATMMGTPVRWLSWALQIRRVISKSTRCLYGSLSSERRSWMSTTSRIWRGLDCS